MANHYDISNAAATLLFSAVKVNSRARVSVIRSPSLQDSGGPARGLAARPPSGKNPAGPKYFLYEYEEHLAAKKSATPRVPWEAVRRRERADTIEHILPQTPSDACWLDRFDESARQIYTHDLGNLCLTKDNSSYGNKCFVDKRGTPGSAQPSYAESSYFSERELANFPDWNITQLKARRDSLVRWALGRWRVDLHQLQPVVAAPVSAEDDDADNLGEVGALADEDV